MKRCLLLTSVLSILCVSCISGPHYQLDATAPFRVERSGRLMKATPGLVGLPEAAFHDQMESLFSLDPWHFFWTPICTIWLAVSTPVYDVINLPRDLYLRNFAGLEVFVCHPDGAPVPNANILACEIEGGMERRVGVFRTDSRGFAYVPRKFSTVRIKQIDFSNGNSDGTFWLAFGPLRDHFGGSTDGDNRATIVCFESETSYAPIVGTVDMAIPFEKEKTHPWLVNVDLMTANLGRPPFKPATRLRIDWAGRELVLDFPFDGGSFPFVVVNQTEEFRAPGSGAMAFMSDENKQWCLVRHDIAGSWEVSDNASTAREWIKNRLSSTIEQPEDHSKWRSSVFPSRIRKGLPEEQRILFKVDGRYGMITEFYVEYGGDLPDPVLHMRWLFNIEKNKDWFDMNGVPVQVGTGAIVPEK